MPPLRGIGAFAGRPRAVHGGKARAAEDLYRRDTIPEILRYLDEGNNPDSPGHFPEWLHTRREMRAVLYQGTCVDIGTVRAYTETCAEWDGKKGKPCG